MTISYNSSLARNNKVAMGDSMGTDNWLINRTIPRNPTQSIMTRQWDPFFETTNITQMIEDSGDRFTETILTFPRAVNSMVSVQYTNANGTPAKLPNTILNNGAFRPPILTMEQTTPLSRLPHASSFIEGNVPYTPKNVTRIDNYNTRAITTPLVMNSSQNKSYHLTLPQYITFNRLNAKILEASATTNQSANYNLQDSSQTVQNRDRSMLQLSPNPNYTITSTPSALGGDQITGQNPIYTRLREIETYTATSNKHTPKFTQPNNTNIVLRNPLHYTVPTPQSGKGGINPTGTNPTFTRVRVLEPITMKTQKQTPMYKQTSNNQVKLNTPLHFKLQTRPTGHNADSTSNNNITLESPLHYTLQSRATGHNADSTSNNNITLESPLHYTLQSRATGHNEDFESATNVDLPDQIHYAVQSRATGHNEDFESATDINLPNPVHYTMQTHATGHNENFDSATNVTLDEPVHYAIQSRATGQDTDTITNTDIDLGQPLHYTMQTTTTGPLTDFTTTHDPNYNRLRETDSIAVQSTKTGQTDQPQQHQVTTMQPRVTAGEYFPTSGAPTNMAEVLLGSNETVRLKERKQANLARD